MRIAKGEGRAASLRPRGEEAILWDQRGESRSRGKRAYREMGYMTSEQEKFVAPIHKRGGRVQTRLVRDL